MTAEQISAIAGLLLSLAFSYTPGLSDAFARLTPTQKRAVMAGLLLVVAGGALVYTCRAQAACLAVNWEDYLAAFVAALVANQATFAITPQRVRRIGPGNLAL